jgi:preprotein translocase subunit SecF
MNGAQGHHRSRWRLTPLGLILAVVTVAMAVLALVTQSTLFVIALIVVIFIWAAVLSSSYPSTRIGRFPGSGEDVGGEAAKEYEREHGF